MTTVKVDGRKAANFVGGIIALVAGLALLLTALLLTFPVMAESGSDRWGERNRPIAILALLGGLALLGLAIHLLRKSFGWRVWLAIIGAGAAFVFLSSRRPERQPDGATPLGGGFYAAPNPQADGSDSVTYRVYFRDGRKFANVHEEARDLDFRPPDCLVFGSTRFLSYRTYVMCGYRTPVQVRNAVEADASLAAARSAAAFDPKWQWKP